MYQLDDNGRLYDPKLDRAICQSIAEHAIRCGLVDPTGKTEEQLQLELFEYLRKLSVCQLELFVIDHTNDLLRQARQFRRDGEYYHACLFYATWSEHWLNGLICATGQRRSLHAEEIAQMIRDTPLRGKVTWLIRLLGLPRLADRHRKAVVHLMDIRNGFVHYKWQGKNENVMRQEEQDIERCVTCFETTVKYLNTYQSRHIFAGSKRRVRRVI